MAEKTVALFLAIILIAGFALRLFSLRFGILSEPDVFLYASVANQTLHNGFHITATLSGVPPVAYREGPPLVLLPAFLALISKQSVYSVMMWLAPCFSLLGIIVAYLLAFELSKNKYTALLAALIYAFLPAALGRGMAGMWRGEVAVPAILGLAMLMFIKWMTKNKTVYAIASLLLTGLAVYWWQGGFYALACVGLFLLGYMAYQIWTYWQLTEHLGLMSPLKKNRIMHLMLLVLIFLAFPLAEKTMWYMNPNISVSEQAPMSIPLFMYYYADWVAFVAIAGAVIAAWYGASEKYDAAEYAMFCMFVPTLIMQFLEVRWTALFALPVAVYGAYGAYALITMFKPKREILLPIGAFAVILLVGMGCLAAWRCLPAPNLTPQLFQASEWLGAHTPANSLVLTLWIDGSVVESIGHRESYSDSIMGGTGMPGFGQFLLAKAGNFTYLNKTLNYSRPNYMLVRKFWIEEVPSIGVEGDMLMTVSPAGKNIEELINGTAPYPIVYNNSDVTIYYISNTR